MDGPPLKRWATGTSDASLKRSIDDFATLTKGRLRATDAETRTTPAGFSQSHYDALRYDRDDLDFREWNEDTGFHGVNRWPTGPGMEGQDLGELDEAERRRARLRVEMDDGF